MSRVAVPSNIIVTYFNLPARAEPIRVALRAANIPFTDKRIEFAQWRELKPTIQPWECLPVLEADGGIKIHQSWNILMYVGRISGLVPDNVNEEFRMNEVFFACDDLNNAVFTVVAKDPEEKHKLRAALCVPGGKVYEQLKKFQNFLGDREFVAGSMFTVGDCALFAVLGALKSGFYDGIPDNCLDDFPKLVEYHRRIASRQDVSKGYENESRPWGKGFRP
jgi:glutathione S-transferase